MIRFNRMYTIGEATETPRTHLPSTYVGIRLGDAAALFIGPGAHLVAGPIPTELRLGDAVEFLIAATAPQATP